jgi:hypothetical protein
MRMKLSALGCLLAACALGCGGDDGDDSYLVDASGVFGGGGGPGLDAGMIPPLEAGTTLDAGNVIIDSGAAHDAGVAPLEASVTVDAAGLDATTSTDASGGGDGGGATDGGPRDGSSADGGGGDAGGATFTRVFALFQETCGTSCHGSTARGGLNMSTKAMAFTELTSPGNAEGTCMGSNRKRVVPFMPAMSLLIQKLEGTQNCGQRMPEGRAALSAAQIGEVRSWITAGAMNN